MIPPLRQNLSEKKRKLLEKPSYKNLEAYPFNPDTHRRGKFNRISAESHLEYLFFVKHYMKELCLFPLENLQNEYPEYYEDWLKFSILKVYEMDGTKYVQVEFIDKWIGDKLEKSENASKNGGRPKMQPAAKPRLPASEMKFHKVWEQDELRKVLADRYLEKKGNRFVPTDKLKEVLENGSYRMESLTEFQEIIKAFILRYGKNGIGEKAFLNVEQIDSCVSQWLINRKNWSKK